MGPAPALLALLCVAGAHGFGFVQPEATATLYAIATQEGQPPQFPGVVCELYQFGSDPACLRRWRVHHDEFDTNTAEEVRQFDINGTAYIAIVNNDIDGNRPQSVEIHQWQVAEGTFAFHQRLIVARATSAHAFAVGGTWYMMTTSLCVGHVSTTYQLGTSPGFIWNGSAFVPHNTLTTQTAEHSVVAQFGSETLLVLCEYGTSADPAPYSTRVFSWDAATNWWAQLQTLTVTAASYAAFTSIGSRHFLAIASNRDSAGKRETTSPVFEWQSASRRFVAFQTISTIGAVGVSIQLLGGSTYLTYANLETTNEDIMLGRNSVPSKVYKWDGTSFAFAQNLPTLATRSVSAGVANGEGLVLTGHRYRNLFFEPSDGRYGRLVVSRLESTTFRKVQQLDGYDFVGQIVTTQGSSYLMALRALQQVEGDSTWLQQSRLMSFAALRVLAVSASSLDVYLAVGHWDQMPCLVKNLRGTTPSAMYQALLAAGFSFGIRLPNSTFVACAPSSTLSYTGLMSACPHTGVLRCVFHVPLLSSLGSVRVQYLIPTPVATWTVFQDSAPLALAGAPLHISRIHVTASSTTSFAATLFGSGWRIQEGSTVLSLPVVVAATIGGVERSCACSAALLSLAVTCTFPAGAMAGRGLWSEQATIRVTVGGQQWKLPIIVQPPALTLTTGAVLVLGSTVNVTAASPLNAGARLVAVSSAQNVVMCGVHAQGERWVAASVDVLPGGFVGVSPTHSLCLAYVSPHGPLIVPLCSTSVRFTTSINVPSATALMGPTAFDVLMQLPFSRLTALSWATRGYTPQPDIPGWDFDALTVSVNDAPCTLTGASGASLACSTAADGTNATVLIVLYNAFNATATVPNLFPQPLLSGEVVSVPVAQAPTQAINVTMQGQFSCWNDRPRITSILINSTSCARVACTSTSTPLQGVLQCLHWLPSADLPPHPSPWSSPAPIVLRYALSSSSVFGRQALLVREPQVTAISPGSIEAAGDSVLVSGSHFHYSHVEAHASPTVYIGGVECVCSSWASASVVCSAPMLSDLVAGFPSANVTVVNAVGSRSKQHGSSTLLYPIAPAMTWQHPGNSTRIAVLPAGGTQVSGAGISLTLQGRYRSSSGLTCELLVPAGGASESQCRARVAPPLSAWPGTGIFSMELLPWDWTVAVYDLDFGCSLSVNSSCRDGLGRLVPSATVELNTPTVLMEWANGAPAVALPPTLPALDATVVVHFLESMGDRATLLANAATQFMRCGVNVTLRDDWAATQHTILEEQSVAFLVNNASSLRAVFSIPPIAWPSLMIGGEYRVAAWCSWRLGGHTFWTTERLVVVPNVSLVVRGSNTSSALASIEGVRDRAFAAVAVLEFSPAAASTPPVCAWDSGGWNTTLMELPLAAPPVLQSQNRWVVPLSFKVHAAMNSAPSVGRAWLRCFPWQASTLNVSTSLLVEQHAPVVASISLPSAFFPSSSGSFLPITEAPRLRLVSSGQHPVAITDATCAIDVAPGQNARLVTGVTAASAQVPNLEISSDGSTSFPPFGVEARYEEPPVRLHVACARRNGDAFGPVSLVLTATPLPAVMCRAPPASAAVNDVFSVVELAFAPTCSAQPSVPTTVLAATRCTLQMSAPGSNATALQLPASPSMNSGHCVWAGVAIPAGIPGQVLSSSLSCSLGQVVIPLDNSTVLQFATQLTACSAGNSFDEAQRRCVPCRSGTFSWPSSGQTGCVPCAGQGMTCADGQLLLSPGFFRVDAATGGQVSADTVMYQCPPGAGCLVNTTTGQHHCAAGFTGNLCAMCADGFASLGDSCRACDARGLQIFYVVAGSIAMLVVLVYVAWFKDKRHRSQASIAFKLILSHWQALAALRLFIARYSDGYASLLGWADSVNDSPATTLSLQCLTRWSLTAQLVVVGMLPVIAGAAMVCVFMIATSIRERCRGQQIQAAAREWMSNRGYLTAFVSALFLTYMSVVSTSMKGLECFAIPGYGVSFLRSSTDIACGSAAHAPIAAIGAILLVALGFGFPVLLAWRLSHANASQMSDPSFMAAWGFLVDGYKLGTKSPPASAQPIVESEVDKLLCSRLVQRCGKTSLGRHIKSEHFAWWESVVLLRKAGLVLIVTLAYDPAIQLTLAALWLGAHLCTHLVIAPYQKSTFNLLETVSLVVSTVTNLLGVLILRRAYQSETGHPSSGTSSAAPAMAILIINVVALSCLVAAWIQLQLQSLRQNALPKVQRLTGTIRRPPRWSVFAPPRTPAPEPTDEPVQFNPLVAPTGGIGDAGIRSTQPHHAAARGRHSVVASVLLPHSKAVGTADRTKRVAVAMQGSASALADAPLPTGSGPTDAPALPTADLTLTLAAAHDGLRSMSETAVPDGAARAHRRSGAATALVSTARSARASHAVLAFSPLGSARPRPTATAPGAAPPPAEGLGGKTLTVSGAVAT